jgi:hypothetical protein
MNCAPVAWRIAHWSMPMSVSIARISVSEGHRIAEMTRKRILDSHESVSDVLVHVDVEDDPEHDSKSQSMPDRSELMKELAPMLADLPEPRRVILHYLNGRIEAELLLPRQALGDLAAVNKAEREIARQLGGISADQFPVDPLRSAGFSSPGAADSGKRGHLAGFWASFCSILARGIAPGIRSPSAKKIVGVPLIANLRPISTLFFTAVVSQSPLPPGALPSIIQSFHALTLSAEHQI